MARFAMARSHRVPTSLPHRLPRVSRDVVCRETHISQRALAEPGELALLPTYLEIATRTARDQTKHRSCRVDALSDRLADHSYPACRTGRAFGGDSSLTISTRRASVNGLRIEYPLLRARLFMAVLLRNTSPNR